MAELSAWLLFLSLRLSDLIIAPSLLAVTVSGEVQQAGGQAGLPVDTDHFWLWAYGRAPRRFEPAELASAYEELRRAPRFAFEVGSKPAGSLAGWTADPVEGSVLAAPVEMWAEVPEHLLPRFSLSASTPATPVASQTGTWRFRFQGLSRGSYWHDATIGPGKGNTRARVDLEIWPAADHVLEVVNDRGSAVDGAVLEFGQSRGARSLPSTWARFATGPDGLAEVPVLPDFEPMSLGVHSVGLVSAFARGSWASLPKRFVLLSGASVVGRVLASSKDALERAQVEAEWWAPGDRALVQKARTSAGEDGRFRLFGLPPGKAIVAIQLAGFATRRLEIEIDEASLFDLGDVELMRGASLRLRILDARDDLPIEGAFVTCASPASRSLSEMTTDARGEARCDGLSAEESAQVHATRKGYRAQSARLFPDVEEIHELRLARSFVVHGRFLDEEGLFPPKATCLLRMETRSTSCALAEDGSFWLEPEPGVPFVLLLSSAKTRPLELSQEKGELGEERDLGTLRGSAGAMVVGRVLDEDGDVLPSARLRASRPVPQGGLAMALLMGDEVEAISDAEGLFELSGLSQGELELRLEAPGFAPLRFPVALEDDEAVVDVGDLKLSAGALVRVVLGFDPKRLVKAVLDLHREAERPDRLEASLTEREADFERVGPGRHRVRVLDPQLLCQRELEILDQREVRVDCDHGRPKVYGRATRGGGTVAATGKLAFSTPPGPGAIVILGSGSPGGLRRQEVLGGEILRPIGVELDRDGQFETDQLAPGRWLVTWTLEEGDRSSPREVFVPDQPEAQVLLDFGGYVVLGKVLDAAGRPVAGARVENLATRSVVFSGADGAFRWEMEEPQPATFKAKLGKQESPAQEVIPTASGAALVLELAGEEP